MSLDDQHTAGEPVQDPAPRDAERALGYGATIRILTHGSGLVRAVLAGELDLSCASELATALCQAVEASPRGVELDLTEVCFCDASTLRALLTARAFARDLARPFAVGPHSVTVAQLLELTGTRSLLVRRSDMAFDDSNDTRSVAGAHPDRHRTTAPTHHRVRGEEAPTAMRPSAGPNLVQRPTISGDP